MRLLLAALVSLLWGSEWLFGTALTSVPRFRLLSLRCLVAAICLAPLFLRKRSTIGRLPILKNIFLGTIIIALPAFFLEQRGDLSPGIVVFLFALIPVIASILETAGGLTAAPALIGGLAGTAFLVRGGLSPALSQTVPALLLLVIVIVIAAALVRAKYWLHDVDVPAAVALQMLTAAVLFGGYSLLRDGATVSNWTGAALASAIALGFLQGSVGYCVFYALIKRARVSQAAVVQWIVPAVGFAESALRYRHFPGWGSLSGGALAIVSAVALLRAPADGDSPLTLQITSASNSENAALLAGSP